MTGAPGNVRLWSTTLHREDSRWTVKPGDVAGVERAWRLLAEYQASEPRSGWRLETRGTESAWHTWNR